MEVYTGWTSFLEAAIFDSSTRFFQPVTLQGFNLAWLLPGRFLPWLPTFWFMFLLSVSFLFLKIFLTFIHFWEIETERKQGWGREGDTGSEAGSRLGAVSTQPDAGLEFTNHEIVTWAEVRRLTDWATQAPPLFFFFLIFIYFWQRQIMSQGGAERERGREREPQAGATLSMQSPMQRSNPWNCATQVPLFMLS